jgi:hypothetical protein
MKKHKYQDSDMFYFTCETCGALDDDPIHKKEMARAKNIIQRDCMDDFEAFGLAQKMENVGIDVFSISNGPSTRNPSDMWWKVWGKGTDKAINAFLKLEDMEANP